MRGPPPHTSYMKKLNPSRKFKKCIKQTIAVFLDPILSRINQVMTVNFLGMLNIYIV